MDAPVKFSMLTVRNVSSKAPAIVTGYSMGAR